MPGHGSFYWSDRTPRARRRSYASYRGDTTADVVIIGGGLTGATAAYVLASGGLDVVLLEADRLASGSTAGGTGAILPQPDATFRAVEAALGLRAARTAWKDARLGALEFASAVRRLRIKADLEPSALLVNARTSSASPALKREQAARKAAGLDAAGLSARAAAAELAGDSTGAMRVRDAFVFDPVRAALGLAAAAERKGARIFEGSLVRRTKFTRKQATVALASGTIATKGVLVATGGPGALFKQLDRHVRTLEGHVVVTEPLSAAMRREVGRRATVITEMSDAPHWLRWLGDNRALFAGALSQPVNARLQSRTTIHRTAQLMYELSVRYPVISGLPARWGWSVPVISTADGLPWIGPHRNYPFHFFSMAFGWHGDGLAWLAAKAALRHFTGETRKEDQVFGFGRS